MPEGIIFQDKDGTDRNKIRIKWWEDPANASYQSISIKPFDTLPASAVNVISKHFYPTDDKPVFFGHYWLEGMPSLYRGNICCLDYSVAKHGYLVAYRYDGEKLLSEDKLVYV